MHLCMNLHEQYLFGRSNTLVGHVLDLKDIIGPTAKSSRSPGEMLKNGDSVSGYAFIMCWTLLIEDAISLKNAFFRTFLDMEVLRNWDKPHFQNNSDTRLPLFFLNSGIHNLNSPHVLRKHIIQVMTEGNGTFWFHLCRLVIYSWSQTKHNFRYVWLSG